MKKFEYMRLVYHISYNRIDGVLNDYGKNGWELCGMVVLLNELSIYIFKREVVS